MFLQEIIYWVEKLAGKTQVRERGVVRVHIQFTSISSGRLNKYLPITNRDPEEEIIRAPIICRYATDSSAVFAD